MKNKLSTILKIVLILYKTKKISKNTPNGNKFFTQFSQKGNIFEMIL